jgi:hypothetical protein
MLATGRVGKRAARDMGIMFNIGTVIKNKRNPQRIGVNRRSEQPQYQKQQKLLFSG